MILTGKDIASAMAFAVGFALFVFVVEPDAATALRLGAVWLVVSLVATGTRNARSGPFGLN